VLIRFLWLWTVFQKWHILFHATKSMMQATLQSCSLEKWFVFMVYPRQLCLIGILSSLATFGRPCGLGLELNFLFSTSCHPQTDGQTEVVNRSLSTLLRVVLKGKYKSWDEYLPHIEFSYNKVVHSTSKLSPFEVVYGFNPLTPLDLLPLPSSFDFVHKLGVSKSKFIKDFHEKVKSQNQGQMEKIANSKNKGKRVRSFNEGDLVWLHLRKEDFLITKIQT